MDLNLDALKDEITAYLEESGFTVFYGFVKDPGQLSCAYWDSERYPDYRMYLEVARRLGNKLIMFQTRVFEPDQLEEAHDMLQEADLSLTELQAYRRRIRELEQHAGHTCAIRMAFDYNQRLYLYEIQTDWYLDYLELMEEIRDATFGDFEEEEDDDGTIDGYFSKN